MKRIAAARVYQVLINDHRMLRSRAKQLLKDVYGPSSGYVSDAHLLTKLTAEPYHWTRTQALDLIRRCSS